MVRRTATRSAAPWSAPVILQNTFSGNEGYGLAITGRAHDNSVFDSFIGPDLAGLAALGNENNRCW